MPSDDPRRVVVIDPATDNVTTIIGKASAAPGVGELRERIAEIAGEIILNITSADDPYDIDIADAVLRVILGEGDS